MLRLSLLRHAKARPADAPEDDFERPLTKSGIENATKIGKYLKRHKLRPDLVFCSGAERACSTLGCVLAELGNPAPMVKYDNSLYHPSSAKLLKLIQKIGQGPGHVMIVGHNPELHSLCVEIVGDGRRKEVASLSRKLPKAGLAVVDFEVTHWRKVRGGIGKLVHFVGAVR